MGRLAKRTAGGTRLEPREAVKVKQLIEEEEITEDEVVYEIADGRFRRLSNSDTVQKGQSYGVVPRTDLASA